ncbi:YncE family protein [Clostridium coskatii]|uniref:Outer membrane protein assembly factor BamB n=1 Tax=Clostridium coskatii TaxID=1705578 RepID=A0A168PBX5_9CLOT|nr:WD40 repeat domain-containing protein [Clostridium coskatii]OAA87553.1 hypothetical protein WX73_02735 [Clostridium coskatii]OBR96453.1 hypothetical protein CLCOS_08910 [Clostridium coskatii]
MKVYELYSSIDGNYVIAGDFEKDTQVWNMRTYTKIIDLKTKYGSGGKRLAISDNGKFCADAAYNRFGVTLYDAKSGEIIWNIKEIKHIQRIRFTGNDENLSVSNNENQTFVLDLVDGKIISKINGARNIIYNKYGSNLIMNDYYIKYNNYRIETKKEKLILDVYCLPNGFACSTVGEGLYVYNTNGLLMWKADNNKNEHFVSISYLKKYNYVCGIVYKYNSPRTAPYYVVYCYNAGTGDLKYAHDLDEGFSYAFIRESEQIISGSGRVFQLNEAGADVIKKIKF